MDRIGKGRDVYAAEDSGFSLMSEFKASVTVSTEINILHGLYPMFYFNTFLVEHILSLSSLVWVPNVETKRVLLWLTGKGGTSRHQCHPSSPSRHLPKTR